MLNEMKVKKRSGEVVSFDPERIEIAITKALKATEEDGVTYSLPLAQLADEATKGVIQRLTAANGHEPFLIESIQDQVEETLMSMGLAAVAKRYILYRDERARMRKQSQDTSLDQAAFEENTRFFSTDLELFQHLNKYSRYNEEKGRRETWPETARRAMDFIQWHLKERMGVELYAQDEELLFQAILWREAMPSMRLLQMAGPAAMRCNVSVYNCSYVAITTLRDFAEILYILMQGTGQSFSVEYEFTQDLPKIKKQRPSGNLAYIIEDSTEGWCNALLAGLEAWFDGQDIMFNYSLIRPAGATLKTKGGKASGPEPLKELLDFARKVILSRQGRRLRPIDVHDIACKIGKIVQVGGVRRAAELSLSDLDDTEMREAKHGEFWGKNPQRTMANNSVAYNEKPSATEFMEEWLSLAKSGAGERGVFNRVGAVKTMPARRLKRLKEVYGPTLAKRMLEEVGVNPCGEIKLLSKQFCNLSMAVVRPEDSWATIKRKVRVAAILGTIQSSMTYFGYLSEDWKRNCEAERLLGVDIPGASDHPMLKFGAPDRDKLFEDLKQEVIKANQEWAEKLGIQPSTAVTCSKPGGNSSVFLGVGHTIIGWNSRYIKRHVRVNAIDPMSRFLIDVGVPHWPEYDDPTPDSPNVWVFAFPLKAPETAWINDGIDAIEMLENWLAFKRHWTEHNPSITVYVRPEEWIAVGNWVYENWDEVGGLAFLSKDSHVYPLAPITPMTEEEFATFERTFPQIPWEKFPRYEQGSSYAPEISLDYACIGGACLV